MGVEVLEERQSLVSIIVIVDYFRNLESASSMAFLWQIENRSCPIDFTELFNHK